MTSDKQTNKKRRKADEIKQRKPSKYFKSCPDIHVRQTDVALKKRKIIYKTAAKWK